MAYSDQWLACVCGEMTYILMAGSISTTMTGVFNDNDRVWRNMTTTMTASNNGNDDDNIVCLFQYC